jgi:hypothetical protein
MCYNYVARDYRDSSSLGSDPPRLGAELVVALGWVVFDSGSAGLRQPMLFWWLCEGCVMVVVAATHLSGFTIHRQSRPLTPLHGR